MDPAQYLAGWQERTGMLFLPALSGARVGDEIAARVGLRGQAIQATLLGRIALVRRLGRPTLPPGVELEIAGQSRPAAAFLALAARGERISFTARPPRFLVERPVSVEHGGARWTATVLNVSERGCTLRWPGPPPPVGDVLELRLQEGLFAPAVRGVVCWSEARPEGALTGVMITARGRGDRAWRSLVQAVATSGAHAA